VRDDEVHDPDARRGRPARGRRRGAEPDADDEPSADAAARGGAGDGAATDATATAPNATAADAALGEAALVAGLRRDEPRAFAEYVRRFHRLLAYYPWRAGLAPDASRDLALEVLEDAMLDLIVPGAVVPRSLRAYLVTRLRRRLANDVRGDARRHVREATAAYDAGDAHAALVGEATLRLCRGADQRPWDEARDERDDDPGIAARLGAALAARLDADERQLLAWLAERAPQREIAAALGLTHAALRKRVERLRVRLRVEATRVMESMAPADRRAAQRLLRRCETAPPGAAITAEGHRR
jgi:RNA polymerase sigma factor (sigma-70 family)